MHETTNADWWDRRRISPYEALYLSQNGVCLKDFRPRVQKAADSRTPYNMYLSYESPGGSYAYSARSYQHLRKSYPNTEVLAGTTGLGKPDLF